MIRRIAAKISVGSGKEYSVKVYSGFQYPDVMEGSVLQDVTFEFQNDNDARSFMKDFKAHPELGVKIKGQGVKK